MPSVICAGMVTVDLTFSIDTPPHFGLKNKASASALTVGGCALNAAVAIARLGGEAHLAGAIGDDCFADIIKNNLRQVGVSDTLLVIKKGIGTARSAVILTPDGERTIINHRDNALYESGLTLDKPFAFDAALADTRWPEGAKALMMSAKKAGKPAIIDAEAPIAPVRDAMKNATHVAFSEQGLKEFVGASDELALLQAAKQLNCWVCVTRGAKPVLYVDGQQVLEVPAFDIVPVNTLGAGDVWHGAFALALAEGRPEPEAISRANAVAAIKSSTSSSEGLSPNSIQLEQFMKENAK